MPLPQLVIIVFLCTPAVAALATVDYTSINMVYCSSVRAGLTVCGTNDGTTRVAIVMMEMPYFLSLSIIR